MKVALEKELNIEDRSSGAGAGPRLGPPLVILAVALALRFVPGWLVPLTLVHFISVGVAPLIGSVAMALWWLSARSIPLRERLIGLAIAIALLVLVFFTAHWSMQQFLVCNALVIVQVVVVVILVVTRGVAWPARRWILGLGLAIALLPWSGFRQDGQVGSLMPQLSLRWMPTAEDRFLQDRGAPPAPPVAARPPAAASSDWPGYRGPARDGRAVGVSFDADWQSRPPRALWRRRVGPAWSSFAVAGAVAFSQEQRGDQEVVVAYALGDGRDVWVQATAERFEEPASGAGPRATPTYDDGRLFTLGATGVVQCLNAATGARLWQGSLRRDVGASVPTWGFSSSPLVMGRAVIVFAGTGGGRSVVAYDRETGDLLWTSGDGTQSYSSGHRAVIGSVEQVLMCSDIGVQGLDPDGGDVLWEHRWSAAPMARIVQPVVLDGVDALIIATGYGIGSRRLSVERSPSNEWDVRALWSSISLKPYFNDLVQHGACCYGFDGERLTCIGIDDGRRRWKAGRYGHGQVVLVSDMDLLLVMTEQGAVVLVEAAPDGHREVARLQALTGKTWNHPVLTQGRLLVRNGAEAACFELPGWIAAPPGD